MAELKPYPAYKDSGVEWLGEIPAHWEVKRLKSIATLPPLQPTATYGESLEKSEERSGGSPTK